MLLGNALLPQQHCGQCFGTAFNNPSPIRGKNARTPATRVVGTQLGTRCDSHTFGAAATCVGERSIAKRRHSAAVVWAAEDVQASKPVNEVEHDEDEFEEYEDEWEDEYEDEYEEGEYEEAEEGEEQAEQQGRGLPAAAAGAMAAAAAAVATRDVKQIPAGQQSVQYTPDDFVNVGYVSKAHGIKGEVKVVLITDEPKKRLGTSGRRLWLQRSVQGKGGAPTAAGSEAMLQRVTVQWGRQARPASKDRAAEWAVKFNEVPNRDQAETLAGCKLLLAVCDRERAPRARDEFFITDLVGLKALEAGTQQLMGIVTEVYDSSASYSLLRLRLAPNEADIEQSKFRSILVPFVQDMVPTVDIAAGQLQVQLPEGLLDTATTKRLRRPYTAEQQAQLRQQLKQRQQQQ